VFLEGLMDEGDHLGLLLFGGSRLGLGSNDFCLRGHSSFRFGSFQGGDAVEEKA
jgi:hypothetical protein